MLITYDITTDYLYKQGEVTGIKKGVQIGIKRAVEAFLKLGSLSYTQIGEAMNVSIEFVQKVKEQTKK